ncbi:MAG TPA: hypothetical protein VEL28_13145, partial [Candidatus Binatia bacterium]|nr:hypothetical protein [Candidatus Binatia bacterium]
GEECDDGTFECCDFHTCQLSSTATACEFDSNECTNDHCDGAGTCVTENFAIDTPCTQDGDPCVVEACNGSGACVSLNDAEAGAPCDAGDSLCTNDACDGSGTCVADAAPDATCSSAATAGLVMIDSSKPGKDKVKFKWKKGPEDFTGIGEPEEDTTYALCIYDDGAIVADGNLPGGSWTDKGAKLQYKDKEGTIDSVTGGLLVFGFDQFSASMSLGGASLALNLGSTVGDSLIAQIRTSTGGCFGAEFSGEEIKKSTESKFVGVEKN